MTTAEKKKLWRALKKDFQLSGRVNDRLCRVVNILDNYVAQVEQLQELVMANFPPATPAELKKAVKNLNRLSSRIDKVWSSMDASTLVYADRVMVDGEPCWVPSLPEGVRKTWVSV